MGTKSIKSNADSTAGVVVANNVVRVTSNEDNGIIVDERGVTIQGPVSIVSNPKQVRVGGLWVFNDPIMMSIPSTLATPNPVLQISSPTGQLKDLMKGASVMIQLLSSFSSLG